MCVRVTRHKDFLEHLVEEHNSACDRLTGHASLLTSDDVCVLRTNPRECGEFDIDGVNLVCMLSCVSVSDQLVYSGYRTHDIQVRLVIQSRDDGATVKF